MGGSSGALDVGLVEIGGGHGAMVIGTEVRDGDGGGDGTESFTGTSVDGVCGGESPLSPSEWSPSLSPWPDSL